MRDFFKKIKRTLRTKFIKTLVIAMTRLDVVALPKLKRLLLKVFFVVFRKEIERAKELLPAEFADNKENIIKKMPENQVSTLLEVFFYEKILKANPNFVKIEGREIIEKALALNKGIIILTAHFGNWELIGYTLAKIGCPIHVMARAQAVNQMTEFMNSFRENRGVRVIMDNMVPESIKLLKQNKTIGLLCDLNAKERGYQTTFFGRKASAYNAPVLLGLRTKAPVIPTFAERMPDGTQVIRFQQPIEFKRSNTMTENIRRYIEIYENAFRRKPEQWCWFHERYEFADLGRTE